MKSIQVQFDDALLARLDASEEVRQLGRSEVLQRAAAEYLGRCCQDRDAGDVIADQYRKAYGREASLGSELKGWEDQGTWPSE
ncbi:MAG: hypothetical protein JF614_26910 [Acidobacteria bacterium]|jgi:hypothetical protein|nr:hypothetical protein [Acidobacteriota bacterium]